MGKRKQEKRRGCKCLSIHIFLSISIKKNVPKEASFIISADRKDTPQLCGQMDT